MPRDDRLDLRKILNPEPLPARDAVAAAAAPRAIYTSVAYYDYRCATGYGVYFGPGDSRNACGPCANDKSVRRSEIRAVLQALKQLLVSDGSPPSKSWVIYTRHEYSAKRMLRHKACSPEKHTRPPSVSSAECFNTRGAPCMDLILQIRIVISILERRGLSICIEHRAEDDEKFRAAIELAEAGSKLAAQDADQQMQALSRCVTQNMPADRFKRVYTDGSTVLVNGKIIAGYGVYFEYGDCRNECGPVTGKGTGPRASLAAILRALEIIAGSNGGHRFWEIVSCRGQYITSAFGLSAQWRNSGWKRNAGKPIANLDIYREIRRVIDLLESQAFKIRGTYLPQKSQEPDLLFADMMARRGAGDTTLELPVRVSTFFDVPPAPEDCVPGKVYTSVVHPPDELRGRISVIFGPDDPRNYIASCGSTSQSIDRGIMQAISKTLRIIESGTDRNWIIYTNSKKGVLMLSNSLRNQHCRPLPNYVEMISKHIARLHRHGYTFGFEYMSVSDQELCTGATNLSATANAAAAAAAPPKLKSEPTTDDEDSERFSTPRSATSSSSVGNELCSSVLPKIVSSQALTVLKKQH